MDVLDLCDTLLTITPLSIQASPLAVQSLNVSVATGLCVNVCVFVCACVHMGVSLCTHEQVHVYACAHVHHIILHHNRYCCFVFPPLLGLMPYNFICVRTGVMLSEIRSLDDAFTWYTMLQLLVLAVVALVPGLVIKRLQTRRQEAKAKTQ